MRYSWIPARLYNNENPVLRPTTSDFESETCLEKLSAIPTQVFSNTFEKIDAFLGIIEARLIILHKSAFECTSSIALFEPVRSNERSVVLFTKTMPRQIINYAYTLMYTFQFAPAANIIYPDYHNQANNQIISMAMIETEEAVKNAEEICATPGLTGI